MHRTCSGKDEGWGGFRGPLELLVLFALALCVLWAGVGGQGWGWWPLLSGPKQTHSVELRGGLLSQPREEGPVYMRSEGRGTELEASC